MAGFVSRQERLLGERHASYPWASGSESIAEGRVPAHPPKHLVARTSLLPRAASWDVVAGTLVIAFAKRSLGGGEVGTIKASP